MYKKISHYFLSIFVAIGSVSLAPSHISAQPSETTFRNAMQPSSSLLKVLSDWRQLQGQTVTVSNVNAFCINNVCALTGGGQNLLMRDNQIERELKERLLKCSTFGCPVTASGVVDKFGNNPILVPQTITFLDGTNYTVEKSVPSQSQSTFTNTPQSEPLAQQPESSKTCPPGQKFEWFFNACVNEEKPVSLETTQNLDRGMLQFCNLTMGIYGKCPCIVSNSMAAGFTTTQFVHLAGNENRKTTPEQQAEFNKIVNACLAQ